MLTFLAFLAVAGQDLETRGGGVQIASHEVAVEIRERVAVTSVTQVFKNFDAQVREGTYLFALPPGASILEFQMWIEGRLMKGEMLERQKAEEVYQRILNTRRDPGIVDHVRDNLWRVRVFPIPGNGGEMKFETKYLEVLPCSSRTLTYTYPLTVPEQKARAMARFSIEVRVAASSAVRGIEAGRMSVSKSSDKAFVARADRDNVEFKKDLVVRYQVGDGAVDVHFAAHRKGGEDGHFLLSITPDELALADHKAAKEVVYLVDASGSIPEATLRRVTAALGRCLDDLAVDDRFNVIAFNEGLVPFRKAGVPPSAENLNGAREFLKNLKPAGRTDLEEALAAIVREKAASTRMVFLISDGFSTAGNLLDGAATLAALEKLDPSTVFYGVRLGDSTDRTLEALAERTGGECVVASPDRLEEAIRSAHKRLSRPVITNARLEFEGGQVYGVLPERLGPIFVDDQKVVAGRYKAPGTHQVTLVGDLAGQEVRLLRTLDFPETEEGWGVAAYFWASRQISSTLTEISLRGESAELKSAVVALAKAYRIMTPYTAFLVLENEEMYAQFGLPRTTIQERRLFKARAKATARRPSFEGLPQLPTLRMTAIDLLRKPGSDPSLLAALRWLATNRATLYQPPKGDALLNEAGAVALAVLALLGSADYELEYTDMDTFDRALEEMVLWLCGRQARDGSIGKNSFSHALAARALAEVYSARPRPRVKEALQRAVSYLADRPQELRKSGVGGQAYVVFVQARDLGVETDSRSIKEAEELLKSAAPALYIQGRLAVNPRALSEPGVLAAARRALEHGPRDPMTAFWGAEALPPVVGKYSREWKSWHQRTEPIRMDSDGHAWRPGAWAQESQGALTALRALVIEACDRASD